MEWNMNIVVYYKSQKNYAYTESSKVFLYLTTAADLVIAIRMAIIVPLWTYDYVMLTA